MQMRSKTSDKGVETRIRRCFLEGRVDRDRDQGQRGTRLKRSVIRETSNRSLRFVGIALKPNKSMTKEVLHRDMEQTRNLTSQTSHLRIINSSTAATANSDPSPPKHHSVSLSASLSSKTPPHRQVNSRKMTNKTQILITRIHLQLMKPIPSYKTSLIPKWRHTHLVLDLATKRKIGNMNLERTHFLITGQKVKNILNFKLEAAAPKVGIVRSSNLRSWIWLSMI